MKNEYPHFKPPKDLDKKMDTIRTQNHATFNINYHIVWIPKYRKKVLGNPSIKSIWARGYYVSTAGFVSQAQVQKYIEQQTKQMGIKQNRNRQVEAKKEIPKQRTLAEIPPKPKGSGILSVS